MTGRRFALVHHARPMMANDRQHWAAKARDTAEWRQTFYLLANEAKVPHLDRARVEVNHYYSRSTPDVGGCAPAAKAAIDGIVDAGVLDDDDPKHLTGVTFNVYQFPAIWKKPGVTSAMGITIIELADFVELVK